ncbi:tol-pal system-associated acyl-CoA thioesterase [soil metagenome]
MDLRVYYEDTDAGGVVYYANYLRFFERARTELLRSTGVDQRPILDTSRIGFVVRRLEIDYLASARLDDLLTITTTVARMRNASIDFEQAAWCDGTRLAAARVRVAAVHLDLGKPVCLPASISLALAAHSPSTT